VQEDMKSLQNCILRDQGYAYSVAIHTENIQAKNARYT